MYLYKYVVDILVGGPSGLPLFVVHSVVAALLVNLLIVMPIKLCFLGRTTPLPHLVADSASAMGMPPCHNGS